MRIVIMRVEANVPQLQEEEVWSRNEWIKWWGRYRVCRFSRGKPRWLVSSYGVLAAGVLLVGVYPLIQINRYLQGETSLVGLILALALLVVEVYMGERFCSTDPGIASFSLPIINERELAAYKNFCTRCKCTQNQSIKHCQFCDVCIEDSWYHSVIMGWCITRKNWRFFCGFWVGLGMQVLVSFA